ncbi:MAG TPA: PEP-CTERM sorting domain-containing protein [Phycisphaerae bacterium]|nr:PEP-CTERM sorting domain-containing protein [Phycisphaerae bacterium]
MTMPVPRPSRPLLCASLVTAILASAALASVYNVSTVPQLNSAVGNARSGDEVVIAPGTYQMTQALQMSYPGVTIRGASGLFEDVILVGGGMNTRRYTSLDEGILVNTDNISIRDLTLKDYYFNAIHIRGENDADNCVISNVRTWDVGERHIKGSGGGSASAVSDNILIEGVHMIQTTPRSGHPDTNDDYIGGIDCMGVRNWTIRDCVAQGIVGEADGGNAAIFLWQGVQGVTIERNTIIGCAKGIGLGNPSDPNTQIFTYPWHAKDIVIRNNFVLRGQWTTGNNIGLELCNTNGVQVYNNTFYSAYADYFRMISPYDDNSGGALTDLTITNNIIRGHCWDEHNTGDWSDAAVEAMGNIVDPTGSVVTPAWFVDAANGDFHLTAAAVAAIDTATPLALVTEDIDTGFRPASPDMGADEFEIPFPGDANQDGTVGIADLVALADHYGIVSMATWTQGDFNRDGAVGIADLAALADHYGDNPGGGSVPEPATIALLALGGVLSGGRRRRRRRRKKS